MHIEPIKDSLFMEWEKFAFTHAPKIMSDRNAAVDLLGHSDPIFRTAGIESFLCKWYLDNVVLKVIFELGCEDPDRVVRLIAVGAIMLFHSRAKPQRDKMILEEMLKRKLAMSEPVPEIVEDLTSYLRYKRVIE